MTPLAARSQPTQPSEATKGNGPRTPPHTPSISARMLACLCPSRQLSRQKAPHQGTQDALLGTHTWLSGRATSREMLVFSSWLRMATASSRFWTSTPFICGRPRDNQRGHQGWLWGRLQLSYRGPLAGSSKASTLGQDRLSSSGRMETSGRCRGRRQPGPHKSTRAWSGEEQDARSRLGHGGTGW